MTVGELIKQLQAFDYNHEVYALVETGEESYGHQIDAILEREDGNAVALSIWID